ncbi:Acetolactate synthase large subunit [Pseudonocardia sp. Ae168_Ps1]|nr:Acetolactate synthase large subunit [Pseudonocardia sp. Ae168_Ps1]OLL77139.1 Acetolactate synthase large subunit [Pseudonocardia sp. Ae150A_Ps1]OLL88753.1 Acetolactate synthase large subunit [Pseudonocardia sp. Ae263_Ps1]OLL91227.1 Acetolactate synthase large subunit [Pseudonocardia sp. Ae356_Ps1]
MTATGAALVCDMAVAGYWTGGYARVSGPRGLAYPVGWGTLGFGLPAALGVAATGTPTLAVVGDGGLAMAVGELATLVQEQLPVTVLVVDDGGYGMLRYDQDRAGAPHAGVDLHTPDLVALAHAYGLDAVDVPIAGLGAAVRDAVGSGRPHLVRLGAALLPPRTTSPAGTTSDRPPPFPVRDHGLQVGLVEGGQAVGGRVDVLGDVVHLVVAGALDDHEVDGVRRQVPQPPPRLGRAGVPGAPGEHDLQRLGHEPVDQVERVVPQEQRVAAREAAVRRVLVATPRDPVVGDGLGGVEVGQAGRDGLLRGVGQPVHPGLLTGAVLLGACGGQGVERGHRPVRLEAAERGAHVPGDDRPDRPDAVVGPGGVHRVAAAGTDAEDTDPLRVDTGERAESVDRVRDVLATAVRVLEVAGLAAAAPLVCRVEHERRDAPGGEAGGVVRADLLLHAAARGGEHDGAQRRVAGVVGQVEVGGELDRPARDRDVLEHRVTPSV